MEPYKQDPNQNPNPYTQQPAAYQQQPPGHYMKPGRGGLILAFGLLGLLTCFIFGICAWVMGKNDLEEMAAGRMDPREHSLTNTGKILGMVSVILNIIGFGLAILWFLFVMLMIGGAAAAS